MSGPKFSSAILAS